VSALIDRAEVTDLLDYGCGKSTTLLKSLRCKRKVRYQAYDPAIEDFADSPEPSEMVACIDVLEHIEPLLLDNVLDHLQRLTLKIGFFTVATCPAKKTLPDGRNAHLIVERPEWWLPKIMERWTLQSYQYVVQGEHEGFFVVVYPKAQLWHSPHTTT
jgi:hypothetical protein